MLRNLSVYIMLPTYPSRATGVMEKAWVADPMVGHTTGVDVQTEGMTGKAQSGSGRKHSE